MKPKLNIKLKRYNVRFASYYKCWIQFVYIKRKSSYVKINKLVEIDCLMDGFKPTEYGIRKRLYCNIELHTTNSARL